MPQTLRDAPYIYNSGRIQWRARAQNAHLNHNTTAGAGVTGGTTEDTTGDTDRDMDAATATEAGEDLSGEGRAIPPSGRGRSSAGRRSAEPSWVRRSETDLENERQPHGRHNLKISKAL